MEINVSAQILRSAGTDPAKSARAADLLYTTDADEGIRRVIEGKGFTYYRGKRRVTDARVLKRIRSLVIPPAWTEVWICRDPDGHLQATGLDALSRKQYRYHPRWVALRGQTKFYRLKAFGQSLPAMRKRIQQDLRQKELSFQKVMAAVISIMEQTHIRIGSAFYEKLYGSFGLATLHDRHVRLRGAHIRFTFTGKKGVRHDISIRNKKLASIVTRCREIPGKHLFQYYDDHHEAHPVHSGDVNDYIREISGCAFSSKDFRTWAGSVEFIRCFIDAERAGEKPGLPALVDQVACRLGNTRSVCRRYYIHPAVLSQYEKGKLPGLACRTAKPGTWLDREEKILMKILEGEKRNI